MLVFYFFALVQVFLAYQSFQGGRRYLEFFRAEILASPTEFTPFATVFVPCRGVDTDLEKNLEKLFGQDYPNFELIFVVDSDADEAVPIIEKLIKKHCGAFGAQKNRKNKLSAKLINAGRAEKSGQKIHNLRRAVREAAPDSEIFVFVDSDARTDSLWLKNLSAPLAVEKIGATTGYRWFVQKNGGLWTHLRSVWNASIASALGANSKNNFCWGGSTAIRRAVFEKLKISERWRGAVSDDFALTNALKKSGLQIRFVPQCLAATVEDCTFAELLEFTTRQMKITRIYSPGHFKLSLIGSALFVLTFWTGVVLLFSAGGIDFWLVGLFLVIMFAFGAGKAFLRLRAVKTVLGEYENELDRQLLPQILLWTLSPMVFLYNDIMALVSKKIVWRGIGYELVSAEETKIVRKRSEIR